MELLAEIASVLASVLLAGLAGNQIADTWTTGSIFRSWQKWLQDRRKISTLAELLVCPFCLSHWTTLLGLVVLMATGWDSPWRIPVYWFAAVKVAIASQREWGETELLDQTAEVDLAVVDDTPD